MRECVTHKHTTHYSECRYIGIYRNRTEIFGQPKYRLPILHWHFRFKFSKPNFIKYQTVKTEFSVYTERTHFAMSHACIILLHIVWWCCVSVLFAAGSAPEEYHDYPSEDQYQCIDPSGKQPTIWSYWYTPMFSLLLSFTALRQRDSNCCVLR